MAAVSDNAFVAISPRVDRFFVNAEAPHVEFAEREAAIARLGES